MNSKARRLLPRAETPAAFDAVRRDETRLRPGVEAICRRHRWGGAPLTRFPDGSLPVYAVGEDLVLKLYAPCYFQERDREALALQVLEGKIPVPTPGVETSGEFEGWGYLFIKRLNGEVLAGAWPRIDDAGRRAIAAQLGTALAALHQVRDDRLAPLAGNWNSFLAGQRAIAVARQRARGLDERWLEQIPDFLAATTLADGAVAGREPDGVLLHTEVMREHLLVSSDPGGRGVRAWRLTGLFDFEPAMIGNAGYEFASVGLFFSCGDAALLREVLAAYGYAPERLDGDISRRFLAYAILHKYSNLPWYMERVAPPPEARTLDALAECWFGVD